MGRIIIHSQFSSTTCWPPALLYMTQKAVSEHLWKLTASRPNIPILDNQHMKPTIVGVYAGVYAVITYSSYL